MKPLVGIFALLMAAAALRAANESKPVDIGLTAEEKAWIAAHPVIRAGHDPTYAPYSVFDNRGQIVGIDPDFLEIVSRRTGLVFEHVSRSSWSETLQAFKRHEIDVLGSVGTSEEREAFMAYTISYTLAPNVIITTTESPYLFDLSELSGRRVALPAGYVGLRNDLNEKAPGHIPVDYADSLECYRAVSRGEVFASIGDAANAVYLIKQHRLANLRLGSIISTSSEIFFGVRKDWPLLVSIMNKAFASITPLERKAINDRWVAVDYMEDRRWHSAFRFAAVILGLAVVVFLVLFWHNRSLSRELAERRRIQAELEAAHGRLQQASREKSELMHTLAHDLRNPLTSVVMGTDLLRLGNLPPEHGETVRRLRTHAQKMTRLIDDLMDAEAIESGQRQFQFTRVDLTRAVRAAVEAFAEPAAFKQLRLELNLPGDSLHAETDEGALRQVIDNLVSNAVKYSPAGQTIEITLRADAGEARCIIADQGPGLAPDEIERLFSKFGKGRARPTGGEKSSGLGLWIAKRVMDALGGRIWCESEPGRGARFLVALPLTPRKPAAT